MNNYDWVQNFVPELLEIAADSASSGGGPFSAMVLESGKLIAKATNGVTQNFDPTAHAEVQAIRLACQKKKDFQLKEAVILSSCEPCPMCYGAIYWVRPKALYYVASRYDAQNAGFDDRLIYDEFNMPLEKRLIPFIQIRNSKINPIEPFEAWKKNTNKTLY